MMKTDKFNLSSISNHRTELMGIATLLILVCHAPGNGVNCPEILGRFMRFMGIGVDIFLFLSGIGMYFSIQKKRTILSWYCHRYKRILIPFLLFSTPYYLFRCVCDGEGVWTFICNITTISFWTRHEGAWFIAMLIPLYFLTPWIAKFIDNGHNRIIPTLIISALCVLLSLLPSANAIVNNIKGCLSHIPSYVLGYLMGGAVHNKDIVNGRILRMSIFCVVLYVAIFPIHIQKNFLLLFPIILFLSSLLDLSSSIKYVLSFMGVISLESYLSNIYLPVILKYIGVREMLYTIDNNNYIYYSVVIVLGIIIAYYGHRVSEFIKRSEICREQ